eukprot:gene10389-10195_t
MVFKPILDSLTLPKKCAIIALPLLLAFGFLFQQMYAQINTLISSSENELPLSENATEAQSEELGNQMVTLVRQLADESELTLDPFLPSYYMMSPMAFQLPR